MPRQDITIPENGRPLPKLTPERMERARAHIRVTDIVLRLQEHVLEGVALTATQIKAAEVLLSKALPSLISSELIVVDERDAMSEKTVLARMQALAAETPELARMLGNMHRGDIMEVPTDTEDLI